MTSSESFPPSAPSFPLPEVESWAVPCPDYTSPNDAFALELRAENIEQLSGGDALRRGETERIEAGGSDGNADLVTGCDRVQVQGTLSEHTGHGLAVQAAHLDATVDGSFDTRAGEEDTVLLAGHMRDTWNGGTAIVAAMTDDTAGGGGVRATAPLDLWVHGLMGLEERPGTCTADGVLAEACGTLYEREYRSAVHAAGLAVFNGTLYQSVRNSFRPLMRVSMGVRNLIAGSGGEAGGDAPSASPPPAPGGSGAQGAEAATDTLAAGRGVARTPPTGTEGAHLDDAAVLTREADLTAFPDDLSELNRSADTAERLGGLRVTQRAAEAEYEAASGVRTSRIEDAASGPPADDAPGLFDGRPAAVALDPVAPAPRDGDPPARGTKPRLGLLGGADEPPRQATTTVSWSGWYNKLRTRYHECLGELRWKAVGAYRQAAEEIDSWVMRAYEEAGGNIADLARRPADVTETERAYDALQDMVRQFERTGDVARADTIRRTLTAIDEYTGTIVNTTAQRAREFDLDDAARLERARLPLHIDPPKLDQWAQRQITDATTASFDAGRRHDARGVRVAIDEVNYFWRVRDLLAEGLDPCFDSRDVIRYLQVTDRAEVAMDMAPRFQRLRQAMVDPSMHRAGMRQPATAGPTPAPAGTAEPGLTSPVIVPPGIAAPAPVPDLPDPSLVAATGPGATEAATHTHHVATVTTPQLAAGATVWPASTEATQATGTIAFDTGLQHAGEPREGLPEDLGEAAAGGHQATAFQAALDSGTGAPGAALSRLHETFAVERALIAGRIPPGFDTSDLVREWGWLLKDTPLENQLESGRLSLATIDSLIETYRARSPEGRYDLIIGHLQQMKISITDALTAEYGYRAGAHWLARVDAYLQAHGPHETAGEAPSSASTRVEGVVETFGRYPPAVPWESTATAGRAEADAGAFLPAGDAWRRRPPGMGGEPPRSRFGLPEASVPDGTGVVYTPAARRPIMSTITPQVWHPRTAQGLGGPGSAPGELLFAHREQIVHRLVTGAALSDARVAELSLRFERAIRAGAIGASAPQWRSDLLRDLLRLTDATRSSPAAAIRLRDIDWDAIEELLRWAGFPSHSA